MKTGTRHEWGCRNGRTMAKMAAKRRGSRWAGAIPFARSLTPAVPQYLSADSNVDAIKVCRGRRCRDARDCRIPGLRCNRLTKCRPLIFPCRFLSSTRVFFLFLLLLLLLFFFAPSAQRFHEYQRFFQGIGIIRTKGPPLARCSEISERSSKGTGSGVKLGKTR